MGSRKEIIKRSLGITEYPWSSDDELEAATLAVAETSLHRPSTDLTAAVDAPGPSGLAPPISQPHTQDLEQQQATSRRNQARQDRDLFWSIVNSPHRASSQRSRAGEVYLGGRVPLGSGSAASEARRGGRSTADIQRLLEFKRFTRNYGALRHRSYLGSVLPVTRVNHSVVLPSEDASASASHHIPLSARLRGRTTHLEQPPLPPRNDPDSPSLVLRVRNRRAARAAPERPERPRDPPLPILDDDEANNNPIAPLVPPEDQRLPSLDVVNVDHDTTLEEVVDLGSSATVTLEEIVSIDLDSNEAPVPAVEERADTSAAAGAPDDTDGRFSDTLHLPAATDNTATASTSASGDSVTPPSNHNVKRKRRDCDDTVDPTTVEDFNESLLRLLECPVCLEWMEPPMSQCRRGHLVCGRCRARLVSCPVCRTTFSSVRNRAMEGVAELLRYPCRHGCGREVRLRRRAPHEASCPARHYHCPAPLCAGTPAMPRAALAQHFKSQHLAMMKIGRRHQFSMKVNSEQHYTWLILAMEEFFHLRVDVDIRAWGVVVYVSYIGPKCDAKKYKYKVSIQGQHNHRELTYSRTTHSDLESSSLNVSRQDCFHLTLDQALNFIRFKNRLCEGDKFLDFNLEIAKVEQPAIPLEESDS